jgi:DNA-binding ferritin-like protein (Dps family)
MPTADPIIKESFKAGEERAHDLIARRQAASFGPPAGYLIAEGDSWFDYPFFQDILEALEEDHHYKIRSASHAGDTAEAMAYEDNQLEKLRKVFEEMKEDKKTPKAVLLSCGGNDVAHVCDVMLNHKKSKLPVLNDSIVQGLLNQRVKAAISALISSVMVFSKTYFGTQLPILIHGYGYPVPDGRGYPILALSGPWLKPGFASKGYVSQDPQTTAELRQNADVMVDLINRFHGILTEIASSPEFAGVVKVVDLRKVFSNDLTGNTYQQDWRDEMHATKPAFKKAAALIAQNL